MASHVQVVLREDVQNLGKTGEVVRVRPGYARNYLIPRGVAALATRASISNIEHEKRAALARGEKLKKEAQGVADALAHVELRVEKTAGDEGKLFGSVTASEIADQLNAKGYKVDRKKISMPEGGVKHLGTYSLSVKLGPGVSATLKLDVVAK